MNEDAKALVRGFIGAYNRGDWDEVRRAFAPAYVHHNGDAAMTGEAFVTGANWLRRGFPDFQLEIADILAEGDRVAVRLVARGTHSGSLFGEATTGRQLTVDVSWICRLEGGHVAEDWETMDMLDLRRKVGALPIER